MLASGVFAGIHTEDYAKSRRDPEGKLFGEELAARFVDAANAPTIFANISNIGWFGDTVAIDQHLQISRLRKLIALKPDHAHAYNALGYSDRKSVV